MRKNQMFAAALAGMLAVSAAGCKALTQTAERAGSMQALAGWPAVSAPDGVVVTARIIRTGSGVEPLSVAEAGGIQGNRKAAPEPAEASMTESSLVLEAEQQEDEAEEREAQSLQAETEGNQPVSLPPTQAEPQAPTEPEQPEPPAAEPEPPAAESEQPEAAAPKSIYDYGFDIEAVRQELIALGQGMGLTHITTDNGVAVTPENASWTTPVTASQSFQGENLKRRLMDYVQSMPDLIAAYGGDPIQLFTIYVEPLGGGSYRIYFLY